MKSTFPPGQTLFWECRFEDGGLRPTLRQTAAELKGHGLMPPPTSLTPSEIVLVHGNRFAEPKRPVSLFSGRTTLLDGKSCVSSRQLATNMIKAALLAHEERGGIRFEMEGEGTDACLMIVPTGRETDWPRATLESRLPLDERLSVADIVFDWLGEDSDDPWGRAAQQGKIMLVLRGVAEVSSSWRGRTYRFSGEAAALPSQVSAQSLEDLFARFRETQPDVWGLLDTAIEQAVRRRTTQSNSQGQARPSNDPWDSEAATDRERFLGRPHVVRANEKWGVLLALVGVLLAVLVGWIARKADLVAFTAVVAGFFTLGGGLLILRPRQLRGIERRYLTWVSSQSPSLSEPLSPTLRDSLVGLVFLVPLLTFFVSIVAVGVARPLVWIGAIAVIIFVVYRLIQELAGERIDEVVKSDGGGLPPSLASTALALSSVPEANGSLHCNAQVVLETITPAAIPPASAASLARLDEIRMRAPAIRGVYRKGVAGLAVATTLLPIVYWLAGPTPVFLADGGVRFSNRTPWFMAGALLATLALLSRKAAPWLRGLRNAVLLSAITGGAHVKLAPQKVDQATLSIRPVILRMLGAFWIAVALLRAAIFYPSLAPPLPTIFIAITLASVLGYLYWIHKGATDAERLYPYRPPLNLLALRVFGSPNLSDFLNLSDAWQWIGTRQLLDGPDTAGHNAKDLLNYLSGRIDRSITADATELHKALDAFSARPDRVLRFPVNSMQCANATWKEALQHLLDQADVVVMDLSSLSEQNRGVAYELGKLVNEVPLNRVVLLFDNSTDLNVLKDILARATEAMAADSPNQQEAVLRVRIFDMGGTTARKSDESAYDWKRRIRTRMNEHALVGMLYDAAQPPRSATTIDRKRDWVAIRWSRLALPGWLRWVFNVTWWILYFPSLWSASTG